ncbi:unnamed protein product [Alopecurus aequalis]
MASAAPALVLLLLSACIAASRAGVSCGDSPASASPTSNSSVFRANLMELLSALPKAAAPTGFASLTRGAGSDQVFVRGLCRGDSPPAECLASLQVAVRDLGGRCASSRSAAGWYDKCCITFADTNAPVGYEELLGEVLYDGNKVSHPDSYERTYYELMKRLAARAANASAGTPMFATGEAVYAPGDPKGTMYGLAECMRDLSAACGFKYTPTTTWRSTRRHRHRLLHHRPRKQPKEEIKAFHPCSSCPFNRSAARHACFSIPRHIRTNKERHDNAADGLEYFSLQVLKSATSNFSIQNKLGEGGYGEVFKGELQDGREIAVKRLSENSSQGFNELKNELVLANRLKHRNLVQLLGVCFQEKLLVYEYMPKGSLHSILFDSDKAHELDWTKRNTIISGIARGLLYLHEESPLKIIHRDLKPSNVLLDLDMNPKISDFGLSRAFGGDQSVDITKRPVGTLGYMSPEYAYCGQVSAKSDMYSFGVIVLEILTGRRNNRSFEHTASRSLLSYVWEKWSAGSMEEVVDPSLGVHYPESEVLSCVQIGLLCVQENPSARPDAPEVVLMLDTHSTSTAIRTPSRPAFCFTQPGDGVPSVAVGGNRTTFSYSSTRDAAAPPTPIFSENDVTISDIHPR